MKQLLALVAGLACFAVSADTTVVPGVWDLYRGTSKVSTHASEAACIAAADALNVLRTYTCRTRTAVTVTADAPPPPPPPEPTPTPPPINLGDNGALLTWQAQPGTPVDQSWSIEQRPTGCNDSSQPFAVIAPSVTALSYSISGLAPGSYTWRIAAVGGVAGEYSNEWCKTVAAPAPPPPTGTATLATVAAQLALVPWNNAAGPWGPQARLQIPAQPVTTRTVNVTTLAQFNAAAAVAGTRVNITASWPSNTTAQITANDVEVVLPAGRWIGAIEVGPLYQAPARARVRISGGGRMGQYRDNGNTTDVTIDGVEMNGDSGYGGAETNQVFRTGATRIAVLNVKAISPWFVWLGNAKQAVIANSNLFHGATPSTGSEGGWGIRNAGGPLTILDSRIQGTRYNNLRMQPGGVDDLLYVARTTFVNVVEGGRVAWLWDELGSGNGEGAIIEDSRVYSGPNCGYPDLIAPRAQYSRVQRTQFFGSVFSQATLSGMRKLTGGDHEWTVGNTFAPLAALPAWAGPGDPTTIPLPGNLPLAVRGSGACTSPL